MCQTLKIALWNSNGLAQHSQEVKSFIINQNIDVMLISETHFTNKTYLNIPRYTIYNTNHPDGTAHGGTAIIVRNKIRHHELNKYKHKHLQATNISIDEWAGQITLAATYCPPKHSISAEQFKDFFQMLGPRFIALGDYNAKHTHWGSRLITPRGRQLLRTMKDNNMQHLSTGEPTYWPTDRKKIPDLLDFCVVKGVDLLHLKAESCLDLSSDHSPVLVTLSSKIIFKQIPPMLSTKSTNWDEFRILLEEMISLNIPLKTENDIDEAVETINLAIQKAAWTATPFQTAKEQQVQCPVAIKNKITEKRKLRKKWQTTRLLTDKNKFNQAAKSLKKLLIDRKNFSVQVYLENLTPTMSTEYSLWRATKKLKQPQQANPPIRLPDSTWAKTNQQKASAFAEHLEKVFQPFPAVIPHNEEEEIHQYLQAPFQLSPPIKKIKASEVRQIISTNLNIKKAPGYDLISGKVLQELPPKGIKFITMIFNSVLRLCYFPSQWKVAQIILIHKPGKPTEETSSYRPISLLPIISKILEKILLKRLLPILEAENIIPAHQFGFRKAHGTIEQVHRVANKINKALEGKQYCSAAFLDISQAFDKVWHTGLLYKLKKILPHNFYQLFKSYLSERLFQIKYQEELTRLYPIISGIPQGSVLGPVLYLVFTADLPTTNETTVATFADDTAILVSHTDPNTASNRLQSHLNQIQVWLKKWRIRANETKSVHVTFTLNRATCPPVKLNGMHLPQADEVKYLGMHLDRRLTWKKHIWTKRKQLGLKYQHMYWLIGHKSQLSTENKALVYKVILKPIWTYGIQLWGTASNSNLEILQRFQSKVLRSIVGAPWYVSNAIIHRDLAIPTVREQITSLSTKYHTRLQLHPNELATK